MLTYHRELSRSLHAEQRVLRGLQFYSSIKPDEESLMHERQTSLKRNSPRNFLFNRQNVKLGLHRFFATAGLDVKSEPTKNIFAGKSEGLRQFRDHHWKALGKENPNLLGPVL